MNRPLLGPILRRILLEALILCVLSTAVGLSLNFKLIFNAFSGKTAARPDTVTATAEKQATDGAESLHFFPVPVELPEIGALLAEGAVLVDARSLAAYREEHLAGALSLPLGQLKEDLADFKRQVPFERILIVYCSGYGCPDSFDLAVRLMKEGYSDVMVYEGGLPEWRDAGRPLERGAE